jgi:glucose/arabinose dehydrogenase
LNPSRAWRVALGGIAAVAAFALPAAAVVVPTSFVVESAVPGTTFNTPTAMAFMPDGRFLVTEQQGVVWMVVNGVKLANPVWSATAEILENGDRGLLGVAIDPNYFKNHFVYFLYTVDPDSNGVDTSPANAFSRLTRYTMRSVGDTNTVDPATRTILIGTDWRHGILSASDSHSIGSLRWGRDGSLMISAGDGAEWSGTDPGGRDPLAFGPNASDPNDDIGAFRAQDITTMNGKILRINPANGHGYFNNPFVAGDLTAPRSRVWEYGLRNPFRFTLRPGTGSVDTTAANPGVLYIGDVGYETWEEIDVAPTSGFNFGWPCTEGFHPVPTYQAATPAHNGCGSVGTATNPNPWTLPVADWNHINPLLSSPSGVQGITSIGGVFYTDTLYPGAYRGRYFYGDYGASWIRVATMSGNNNLITTADFGTSMDGPVDLERSPINGDLYYVAINTGEVRHIRYTGPAGGNAAPVARMTVSPGAGPVPLVVTFTGSDSFDPEGNPLTYAWTFGDGGISTVPDPVHPYTTPGSYTATLTVDDGRGGTSTASAVIIVGASASFPTAAVLDNFNRANGALGGSWSATSTGLSILNNVALVGADVSAVWNPTVFGADQEVFATLSTVVPSAGEVDLMLKVQGTIWTSGHIEVWYDAPGNAVHVATYDPVGGWVARGNITGVSFASGDQFGARCYANGIVDVFRNHVNIGSISCAAWPPSALTGRIGVTYLSASGSALDDFGGGNWAPQANTSPVATVTSPNGGESWTAGTSHPITWVAADDVGVTGVDLYYREAPTTPWVPLAVGIPNSGTFTWFVHNTPTTTARVRAVAHDIDGNTGADSSNADFTIVRQPGGRVATTLRDFKMPGTQPLGAGGFTSHNTCLTCHGGYDNAVEPGHNWRGTMMSQAARDPLFYACLAIAEQDAPSSGDLCIRCHAPFAWLGGRSQPTDGSQIDALGRDGVSCDFCHRMVDPVYKPGISPTQDQAVLAGMLPAHVPTGYSNGQYVVDASADRRGPYSDAVTPHPFIRSPFHEQSELCATCHEVSNPVYTRVASSSKYAPGPLDTPADSISSLTLMPLERTFSEWKNSAFPAGVTAPEFAGNNPGGVVSACQDCHVRSVTGAGCNMTNVPTRSDLPLHDMMGGNAWAGGVIQSLYPSETDSAAIVDGAGRAVSMLQKAAAMDLTVAALGDSFLVSVRITNHTGHKLPTGYPEGRRMWINVQARDVGGNLIYESGAYSPSTGVLTADADARIYEAQLGLSPTIAGTTGLASGPAFHFALNDTLYKDNRIPPQGFNNAAFAVFGGKPVDPAGPSPRYADGQNWDTALYHLPAAARSVTARLYYQTTSKEYVEFLRNSNLTNTAGQTLFNAWVAKGRAAPVSMLADSLNFTPLGVTPTPVPGQVALRAGRNPFHGPLELWLALPRDAAVTLEVLDVSGRVVSRPSSGVLPAGEHRLAWDGRDAAGHDVGAGVFWAVVRAEDKRFVRRVVRMR